MAGSSMRWVFAVMVLLAAMTVVVLADETVESTPETGEAEGIYDWTVKKLKDVTGTASDKATGASESAKKYASDTSDSISDKTEGAKKYASDSTESAKKYASDISGSMSDKTEAAKKFASDSAESAKKYATDTSESVKNTASESAKGAREYVTGEPADPSLYQKVQKAANDQYEAALESGRESKESAAKHYKDAKAKIADVTNKATEKAKSATGHEDL